MYRRRRGEGGGLGDRSAHRQGGRRVDRDELEIAVSAGPLRVGCIGIGWWSDVLADAIKRSGKIEILSCYTRSAEKREKFAAKYGCRPAASYQAILADAEIEA